MTSTPPTDRTVSPAADSRSPLTLRRMIWANTRYSWRVSSSVALGVATATAVIVGALLVGDSMRGSLRSLTIERLGKTESIVAPGNFFSVDGITRPGVDAVPLILFPQGVVESRGDDQSIQRAGSVQVIAGDESFWDLDVDGVRPRQLPTDDGVVLNAAAAAELGVAVGDQVTVRLPGDQAVPADSPLGRRDIQTEGLPRMEVLDIIPDRGLGRFAVSPSQAAPQNVYLRRETVAEVLQRSGQANLLLFAGPVSDDDLQIKLADLGLSLQRIRREFNPDGQDEEQNQQQAAGDTANADATVIYDYYSLTSDRLLLPEPVVERLTPEFADAEVTPLLTYLANAIERLNEAGEVVATVPYSTITAIDSSDNLPLNYDRPDTTGDAADDAVPLVLNDWTAEALGAEVGTPLRVAYYEPEVESGREVERYFAAVVTDIVPITQPSSPYRRRRAAQFDQPPTVYNDPDLTPTVPGVTDQDSISDWDLPFALEREISKADDTYWNEHRLTPKAFLPLEQGRRLFGSRFGQTTGLRIPVSAATDRDALEVQLLAAVTPLLPQLGWAVQPIRAQQLAASRGTTPFDGLFLALSFFVILAAVMLIAMLFRLGLIQRMKQFGTLLAIGWTPRRVTTITLAEGLIVATGGVALGVLGGVGYALGVLWALRSWWVGAVTVPFLSFHWTPGSLVIGAAAGWLVAAVTLALTVRWLLKINAQGLLTGRDDDRVAAGRSAAPSKLPRAAMAMALVALAIALWGAAEGGQTAAGAFVGGGMLLLIAALLAIYARLRQPRRIATGRTFGRYSLGLLAARNGSRHPLRSTMTIGLMATASFLIIAIAAFRLEPTEEGTGGFELVGQSAQPLYRDLSDRTVQNELLGPDAALLDSTIIAPMRLRLGQDASCNNLYQATQPTVLGVPASFSKLMPSGSAEGESLAGFQWAAGGTQNDGRSPWDLLAESASGTEDDPIPVVIDQNTAMWSLQITQVGQQKAFEYEPGQPIWFRVVGMLSNSILQGRLLIGEANFERTFPEISGYQFFLIDTPDDSGDAATAEAVTRALENRLGDVGMDVSDARVILSGLLAVQNTYLRTFQSLGGLGLLLGTIGLAVAQLRSVLERRQELAVMRAIGFTRRRLAAVVMSETASLLLTGIGCGAGCAVLAVLPYALISGLQPPLLEPLLIVLGIIVFGMLAGLVAVRRVTRMPLLQSLRSE